LNLADVDRLRSAIDDRACSRVDRGDLERAGEVVGRTERNHSHRQPGAQDALGGGVHRPVASADDDQVDLRRPGLDQSGGILGALGAFDAHVDACRLEARHESQCLFAAAGADIHDHERATAGHQFRAVHRVSNSGMRMMGFMQRRL
jgi:hypothetical protein